MNLFSFQSLIHACEWYLLDTNWTFRRLLAGNVPGVLLDARGVPTTAWTWALRVKSPVGQKAKQATKLVRKQKAVKKQNEILW